MKTYSSISRRHFIANSALAGIGAALSGNILAACASGVNKGMDVTNTDLGKRKLGRLEVTELGFGCMNIAWAYGNPPADADAVKLIQSAYHEGIRFFDTAEKGNSHMLMMDTNNREIADFIIEWLSKIKK